MDRWTDYLYGEHSESTLKEWASRLQFFRFFKANGGHAGDYDSLDIALKYDTTEQLIAVLKNLEIEPSIYTKKPPQAEFGKTYSNIEREAFPILIHGTEWIEQPGICEIFEKKVHIWCTEQLIKISILSMDYGVCEGDVESAEKIEKHLGKMHNLIQLIVDPPKDSKHYICPKYYPHFFDQ